MAEVTERLGAQAVQDKIGVDATGLPLQLDRRGRREKGREINPLVNPGAIASTSLMEGADSATKWKNIISSQSEFAGRQLTVNWPVYVSEAGDNLRNQAIAHLLFAYGRMYFDPVQSTDVAYSAMRDKRLGKRPGHDGGDLFANGGVNPVTNKKVVSPETVMYSRSWLPPGSMTTPASGSTIRPARKVG